MNPEKPGFPGETEQPAEVKEEERIEMPPEQKQEFLGDMNEYTRGLRELFKEKKQKLADLERNGGSVEEITSARTEVTEIEHELQELESFEEEGRDPESRLFTTKE